MNDEQFEVLYDKELDAAPKKVLHLFLEGHTEKEIADELCLDRSSINRYLSKLCNLFFGKIPKAEWEPLSYADKRALNQARREQLIQLFLEKKPELVSSNALQVNQETEDYEIYLEPEKLQKCYKKIVEPGALIRIKGPHKTGKTLLLNKIIDRANEEGYDLAIVNFAETDAEVLSDYQKLLRWFCLCLGDELELEAKVEEHFQGDFGNNTSCTNYLEKYLLAGRSQPLVLVLEGVDAVFEIASFNHDFCRMLRAWHDTAKLPSRRAKIWKPVRLIIVHSTEVYGDLDINSSPLAGVGLTVPLSGFNLEQVKQLAGCYGLGLNDGEFRQFMDAFGGHPYLVQNAMVALKNGEFNLTELLEIAPTEASPFCNHLRELLRRLERQPDLAAAYLEVLGQNRSVQLSTNLTFKLESLGLVKVEKDVCRPYCEVYRQYFSSRLSGG